MAKPELRDHRKFLKLKRLLGAPTPHVLGYLECLWNRGYQTGDPALGDADDVEAAAEFPGERGVFTKAAHEAGFLDVDTAGNFIIHDLFDHSPAYAKKRMVRNGTAPDGVKWSSVSGDDTRKMPPGNRQKGKKKTESETVRADDKTSKNSPDGQQVSPHGLENGKNTAMRTTEPRTENLEPKNTPLPPASGGETREVVNANLDVIKLAPYGDLVAAWSAAGLPGAGQIHDSPHRRQNFENRQRDDFWRANWRKGIDRLSRSRRAKGGDPGWTQGLRLDTFLRDSDVLLRVLEGDYDDASNKPPAATQAGPPKVWRAEDNPLYDAPSAEPMKFQRRTQGPTAESKTQDKETAAT